MSDAKKKFGPMAGGDLMAAWRDSHPDAVKAKKKSDTIAEKLANLKELDPDVYAAVAKALAVDDESEQ